ncbi:spermidine synthase-like isoform X2 [Dendronephthya gigantea]|uniref:spermidine synthase-like isoform X2 n=1 Tax=Dendronephthya gigantea TaxID=151771 RepID=UPI00106C12AE|nr:spermidine synthase-like isoform X2 [Dendronephthya gigantea]
MRSEDVVKYCKKYLPKLSCGYASSKHKLHIGCGKEFMKQYKEEFDVIITDSSDCEGPGSALFQKEYFELVSSALKPDGIMCGEGECPWLDSSTIRTVLESCKSFFPVVQYAFANVPTYPCGQIGFFLCSRNKATRFADPVTIFTEEQLFSFNLRYYNSDIHKAAFATPQYFKKFYDDYDGCDEIDNQNWIWQNVERSPGQSFGLVKKEIMLHKRTDRCDVVVFKNSIYGNVLVVDDIMQYTEKDQPLYEESLAHLALNSHPFPKKVLIIGGFSGGIIHEVAKHQAVETVTQIEQSQEIADVAKEYFPRSAAGYNNSKLHEFCVCDYQDFLRRHLQEFDVIITAPDDVFFNTNFSELLKSSLKQGGLCISKATSFWTDLEKIGKQVKRERELFPLVKLAYICIPTFPYGQATFVLRSLNKETNFEMPIRRLEDEQLLQMTFYNADVHAASLVLPEFVRKAVED